MTRLRLALYNENDPKTAAWLRELIARELIESGDVDARSIIEVQPDDCSPRSHFFAGIGGWPYALALAGWPADRPVWTGSCPCQPFSAAGKRLGTADARHLWPEWLRLISECRPPTIFGEQVASKAGREWLAGICADLEALGYAVGAADLCVAGVGAPHIRQRLYWVADAKRNGDQRRAIAGVEPSAARQSEGEMEEWERGGIDAGGSGAVERLAEPPCEQVGRARQSRELPNGLALSEGIECDRNWDARRGRGELANGGRMGDTERSRDANDERRANQRAPSGVQGAPQQRERIWPDAWQPSDLLPCADGKQRRVESGTFPLAHGVPARVGRLRGYGNAIVPQVAAEFVRAFMEATA
jgi:DNA (cytosine-5)-methyltransferase 1